MRIALLIPLLVACGTGPSDVTSTFMCQARRAYDYRVTGPGECWRLVAQEWQELSMHGDCPDGAQCLVIQTGERAHAWVGLGVDPGEEPSRELAYLDEDGACPLSCPVE